MKGKKFRILAAVVFVLMLLATPGASTYITVDGMTSYGGFYVSSSGASGGITAATYLILGGTTTALALEDFAHSSPNRLTYTGVSTKSFDIICAIAFTSTQSNQIARFRIAKGGSTEAGSEVARKLGTGTDLGALAIVHSLSLATNEYVEVYATLDTSSSHTITADNMVCLIRE